MALVISVVVSRQIAFLFLSKCTIDRGWLTALTARQVGTVVKMDGRTASELGSEGFYVEKMQTGDGHRQESGQVAGNGTSTEPHEYSFVDI